MVKRISQLFIQAGPRPFKMIPLNETYFVLDGEPDIRLEFTYNEQNEEHEMIARFPDGRTEVVTSLKELD